MRSVVAILLVMSLATLGSPASGLEPTTCADMAPRVREYSNVSKAALANLIETIPDDIEFEVVRGDRAPLFDEAVRTQIKDRYDIGGSSGTATGDYMLAAIDALLPMTTYVERTELAALALETCAAGG